MSPETMILFRHSEEGAAGLFLCERWLPFSTFRLKEGREQDRQCFRHFPIGYGDD